MSAVHPSSYDALLAAAVRADNPVTLSTGAEVQMRGLTVVEFLQTIREYPAVREILLNAIAAGDEITDEGMLADLFKTFVDAGPEAIATLIAKSLGLKGTDAREAVLSLSDEDFFALLEKSIELTMPRGVGDFFGRVGRLAVKLGLVVSEDQQSAAAA